MLLFCLSEASELWKRILGSEVPNANGPTHLPGERGLLQTEPEVCHKHGACVPCTEEEETAVFCKPTGKRELVYCEMRNGSSVVNRTLFEPCNDHDHGGSMAFWKFQSAMAICLALSLIVIHVRQSKIQAMHDLRLSRLHS